MQYGWMRRFRVNRPLTPGEKQDELPKQRQESVVPSQRMGLIRINSTYIDWIDPCYADRGMFNTAITSLVTVVFGLFFIGDIVLAIVDKDAIWLVDQVGILFGLCFFYFACIRFEFFTYTHYPIRFNRKNRKIYVFRHPRKGGLLTVPWDDVFFHVGDNGGLLWEQFKHNIRGEILDGDTVKDTFAIGHDAERMQELYDRWEFIVRYMEGGPDAVADDPLDKYVELSVASNWDNCFIFSAGNCNADSPAKRFWRAPFIYWFAATRWLVFKTCKAPAFPPKAEAECVIEPNDPNGWPTPRHTNQFDATVAGVAARGRERMRQTCAPRRLAGAQPAKR